VCLRKPFSKISLVSCLLIFCTLQILVSPKTHAIGVEAGRNLTSTATMTYTRGAQSLTQSASATTVVQEVLNFTTLSSADIDVINNQANALLSFQLRNDGNGSEDFIFNISNTGDFSVSYQVFYENFSTTQPNNLSLITGDTVNNNEIQYITNDVITLSPDQHIIIYVVSQIPNAIQNGNVSTINFSAVSQSTDVIGKNIGDIIVGAGDDDEVTNTPTDLIIATANGTSSSAAEYRMNETGVNVEKTILSSEIEINNQIVTGRFVKDAIVTYQVSVIINDGTAENLVITDELSNDLDFVPGSIETKFNSDPYQSVSDSSGYLPATRQIRIPLGDRSDGTYLLRYKAKIK